MVTTEAMPKFALEVNCRLENVTDLKPGDTDDHDYRFKFLCSNCGEKSLTWQTVNLNNKYESEGSRGEANYSAKCKNCSRQQTLTMIEGSSQAYTDLDSEKFKAILVIDCRGMEPIDYSPTNDMVCQSTQSSKLFQSVNLEDGDWVDYDDTANVSVGIYDIESRFVKIK